MDIPIRGSGWREAEWEGMFYHHASAWKTQENATLLFDFLPRKSPYILRGKFAEIISTPVLESIQIRLNQHLIPYRWLANGEFEAAIPFNLLLSGSNTLAFHSIIDPDYYGLSIRLAWFEILPTSTN
jgi:hypothetical protein